MKHILIFFIKIYQITLSPYLGNQCRFYPTCSNYAVQTMCKHGAIKGSYYTLRRLLKCHQWHDGGHDPVP